MSFGFGNTSGFSTTPGTSAFGATAAKPTAFGAPLAAATSTPSFGLGTAAGTTSGFGGFGAPAPASTGFGFGATSTAPTFGGFGTTATSAPSTGFSFGAAASSAPATGFSFGSGAAANTATTASTGFGGFGGFGAAATAPTFGQTGTTGFAGFGSNFGAKPATGFGTTFGAPAQPLQQQQPAVDPSAAFYESILNCHVFGDDRDDTLKRWNLLQALYGCGKGFYSQQAAPVDYDMKNPFCRFKAVAYNARPTYENKDGCVALVFTKKEEEIRNLEQQIITNLGNILGNKPNLAVSVEAVRPMSDTKTVVLVSVQEKAANGSVRKIPAQELTAFLLQPMTKQQLTNLQVENLYPQVEFSAEQLREYLDTPPAGFDAQAWQQAQDDNPLPDRLIPVPVIGFNEVRWRVKCQEKEANMQLACLEKMADDMAELQRQHTTTVANIVDYKSRLVELQHRILKVVILQEKSRKMGMSLLPDEEALHSRLEALEAAINSTAFKNRIAALSEGVKSLEDSDKEPQRYKMDPNVVSDIKQFLNMGQSGISHMIETIQTDLAEMKVIKDGMTRLLQRPV